MKVCIFSNDDPAVFQSSINAFIADKKVVDIKYQSMTLVLRFTNGVSVMSDGSLEPRFVMETEDDRNGQQ